MVLRRSSKPAIVSASLAERFPTDHRTWHGGRSAWKPDDWGGQLPVSGRARRPQRAHAPVAGPPRTPQPPHRPPAIRSGSGHCRAPTPIQRRWSETGCGARLPCLWFVVKATQARRGAGGARAEASGAPALLRARRLAFWLARGDRERARERTARRFATRIARELVQQRAGTIFPPGRSAPKLAPTRRAGGEMSHSRAASARARRRSKRGGTTQPPLER